MGVNPGLAETLSCHQAKGQLSASFSLEWRHAVARLDCSVDVGTGVYSNQFICDMADMRCVGVLSDTLGMVSPSVILILRDDTYYNPKF